MISTLRSWSTASAVIIPNLQPGLIMDSETNSSTDCSVSSRCPGMAIGAVLLSLCIAYAVQIWGLYNQRNQFKTLDASLIPVLPQVQAVNAKLQGLSEELIKMASTSPAAERIVREFNIKQNAPAAANK